MPRVEAHIRYEAPVRIGTTLRIGIDSPCREPPPPAPHLRDEPRRRWRCASRPASCASAASNLADFTPRDLPDDVVQFVDRIQALAEAQRRWPRRGALDVTAGQRNAPRRRARAEFAPRAPGPEPRAPQGLARLGRLRAVLRLGERPHARPARRAVLAADDRRRARPGAGTGLRDRPGDDAARARRRPRRRRRSLGADARHGPAAGSAGSAAASRPTSCAATSVTCRSPRRRSRW